MITIENLTRAVWLFPIGAATSNVYLTVGDAHDTDEAVAKAADFRDPRFAPDPVARLTQEEWASLGPANRNVIREQAAEGCMRISGLPKGDAVEIDDQGHRL